MSAHSTKPENLWLNLGCNVAVPALVLLKLNERLGPKNALITALAFPLGYGIYDLIRRRTFNVLSGIGIFGTLVTGGLGLLKLDPFWFAVKDAATPAVMGLAFILTQFTPKPLIRSLLFNPQVIEIERVEAALDARGQRPALGKLLASASWLLGLSFAFSAVVNFFLARHIITAMPDTKEFNAQVGQMFVWSLPVILLPQLAVLIFALWRLFKGLEALTGLTMDDILRAPPPDSKKTPPAADTKTADEAAKLTEPPPGGPN